MAMRPCLRSTARRRTNASGPSLATKPSGSRKPAGACTPSVDSSTARSAVEAGAAAGAWKAAADERQRAIASFIFEIFCEGGWVGARARCAAAAAVCVEVYPTRWPPGASSAPPSAVAAERQQCVLVPSLCPRPTAAACECSWAPRTGQPDAAPPYKALLRQRSNLGFTSRTSAAAANLLAVASVTSLVSTTTSVTLLFT
mmetsp:Transcript_8369/g.21291  ORF Transcript_8369/g.21291 Transcript_8369/m.21291 type:complete len:200 (+) Transcript_8369:450-1049(+)